MKRNWVRVAGVAGQTGAGQVRAHGRLGKQSGFPIFFFLFSFSFLFFFFFFSWARFGRCFFELCCFPTFDVVQAGCVRDSGFRFWVLGVGNVRAWGCVRVRELKIFPWYFSFLSMSVLFLFIITPTTLFAYLPTYLLVSLSVYRFPPFSPLLIESASPHTRGMDGRFFSQSFGLA
ncbi:uncharacterized protein IWZ02DRAFT_245584 [Phyllosticta citriasiana]|uniref:uncharacterized protein n=1 Tax=Phyllosticta citriasiana TaxID=595635 RepID=UPI0030FDA1CA